MSENQVNNAPAAEEETAQDINILKKVRLEKLAELVKEKETAAIS